ncbi:MAG TPA: hypothetical protein VJR03_15030 [Nitrospira sp.]|nr:hypothetical protein [Nitrospira sp.]
MAQILTVSAHVAAIFSDITAVFTNIPSVLAQILPVTLDVSVSLTGLGRDCRLKDRQTQRQTPEHNPFARFHNFLLVQRVLG